MKALAASGLRALRYAREIDGIGQVVALDNDKGKHCFFIPYRVVISLRQHFRLNFELYPVSFEQCLLRLVVRIFNSMALLLARRWKLILLMPDSICLVTKRNLMR